MNFSSLGLVVIDEQHRFGVAQRARLWTKNIQPPHVLVMTATPIPRTLAMNVVWRSGILLSLTSCAGRKPITTIHKFATKFHISGKRIYHTRTQAIAKEGRQVFTSSIPLIKESEKINLKNLEEGYPAYPESVFRLYRSKSSRQDAKFAEKDEQMQLYFQDKLRLWFAGFFIEVGVITNRGFRIGKSLPLGSSINRNPAS